MTRTKQTARLLSRLSLEEKKATRAKAREEAGLPPLKPNRRRDRKRRLATLAIKRVEFKLKLASVLEWKLHFAILNRVVEDPTPSLDTIQTLQRLKATYRHILAPLAPQIATNATAQ
jgi:hypothetical protein